MISFVSELELFYEYFELPIYSEPDFFVLS